MKMVNKLTLLYLIICILNFSVNSYNKLYNNVRKKAEFIQVSTYYNYVFLL